MRHLFGFALVSVVVASAFADNPQQTFTYVDLQPYANRKLTDRQGLGRAGSELDSLPTGTSFFGDARFKVDGKLIQLGSTVLKDLPQKADGIKVDLRVEKLHFLHANCFGGGPNVEGDDWYVKDGTLIGEYRINFEDRTSVIIPIVYGDDVRDWFYVDAEKPPSKGKVVWEGTNELSKVAAKGIRLYSTSWENAKPDKRVISIDYSSKKEDTVAAPFCIAITVEGKQSP